MLATNMIRKDLNATSQYEAGLTLSSLSCFLSPDLARYTIYLHYTNHVLYPAYILGSLLLLLRIEKVYNLSYKKFRDLSNDVMSLLTSTKPYLRKKGVLLLYKVFLRYPDALRPAFPRLKEKLEDPDPGVQV